MPSRLRPENAEAILCIVERDALDETRQHFLGVDSGCGFIRIVGSSVFGGVVRDAGRSA
jgi:hypothetical protein